MSSPLSKREAMQMALEEARRGEGFVSPNPLVGCVILDRDGRLLARGYHVQVGGDHAEIHALKQIKDSERLDGAQIFVTLEPCAHEGRTPSCAKRLAQLPIRSVTFGITDPNPLVAGEGAEILRRAGKEVHRFDELKDECEELAEIFLANMRFGRPFVAMKVAASIDGQIALDDGRSQWITGAAARKEVLYRRGCYDAVLTGVGTFLQDDPRLDARDPHFENRPNRIVLLDPNGKSLKTLKASKLWSARRPEDIFLVTAESVKCDLPVRHIALALDENGNFDLSDLLERLKTLGIFSIFVESGARTTSLFLNAGLVDRLFLFQAPKILGRGKSWTSGLRIDDLESAIRLENLSIRSFGEDILISARPKFSPAQD